MSKVPSSPETTPASETDTSMSVVDDFGNDKPRQRQLGIQLGDGVTQLPDEDFLWDSSQ